MRDIVRGGERRIILRFRVPIRRFIAAVGEPVAIRFATGTPEAVLPLFVDTGRAPVNVFGKPFSQR